MTNTSSPLNGTIKFLKNGYGFLTDTASNEDYFFHASGLEEGVLYENLSTGDEVTFELAPSKRGGQMAVNVVVVNKSSGGSSDDFS